VLAEHRVLQDSQRFFFHTFPRWKKDETREATIERALKILDFMKQVGLVLAPEIVTWELPLPAGNVERLSLLQRRACFTELAYGELADHAAIFGPFSLAFDIDRLRNAGLTPVIYAPQGFGLGTMSQISSFCVKAAWHTRYILERLQELKNICDPAKSMDLFGHPLSPTAQINLTNVDAIGKPVAEYPVPAANIDSVMKYIGFRNIPFDHSIGMLSVFLNIFYPTDNSHTSELLEYYRQREWRLIGSDLSFNGRPIACP
jgi:hypothetical protein